VSRRISRAMHLRVWREQEILAKALRRQGRQADSDCQESESLSVLAPWRLGESIFKTYLLFSRSLISSNNTSCLGGAGGAAGFASSLRRTLLISLTIMKIANATMMKSNSACRNTP